MSFSCLLRSQESVLMPCLVQNQVMFWADWEKYAYSTERSCGDLLICDFGKACVGWPGLPASFLVLLLAPWTFTAADESLLKQGSGGLKALPVEEVQGRKCCFQPSMNPTLGTFTVQRRQVLFIKCQLVASCRWEMRNTLLPVAFVVRLVWLQFGAVWDSLCFLCTFC